MSAAEIGKPTETGFYIQYVQGVTDINELIRARIMWSTGQDIVKGVNAQQKAQIISALDARIKELWASGSRNLNLTALTPAAAIAGALALWFLFKKKRRNTK